MNDNYAALSAVEFAINPEPRCPCVLLLDTSGSMEGEKINALNQGLAAFQDDMHRDALASRRVEVAIITFDSGVTVVQDFVTADQFQAPVLQASGVTLMGSAIHAALDMIRDRKEQYKASGTQWYRPWIFLVTDGEPHGEPESIFEEAAQRVQAEETGKRVAFFAVGVEGANMARLAQTCVRQPVSLKGLNFIKMFVWLSRSSQRVAHSRPDEQVPLPPPSGWGAV